MKKNTQKILIIAIVLSSIDKQTSAAQVCTEQPNKVSKSAITMLATNVKGLTLESNDQQINEAYDADDEEDNDNDDDQRISEKKPSDDGLDDEFYDAESNEDNETFISRSPYVPDELQGYVPDRNETISFYAYYVAVTLYIQRYFQDSLNYVTHRYTLHIKPTLKKYWNRYTVQQRES